MFYRSIKKYFTERLSSLIRKIIMEQNEKKFLAIKGISGVHIANGSLFEEGSTLSVEGDVKRLEIKQGFSCKRFCNFLLYPGASLIIHENVFFNNHCSVNCLHEIEIGANSIFGEGVKMYDHNHQFYFNSGVLTIERENFDKSSIKIGKNCWIGSNVTILQGVNIGDNVIIGANCLIYKSV